MWAGTIATEEGFCHQHGLKDQIVLTLYNNAQGVKRLGFDSVRRNKCLGGSSVLGQGINGRVYSDNEKVDLMLN